VNAEAISRDIFRAMLPSSEAAFQSELELWHPELDRARYLRSGTYPRCWLISAAITLSTEFPEYARALAEEMTATGVIKQGEAARFGDVTQLDHENWRLALCHFGRGLYFFGPPTMVRAFALGLSFASSDPLTTSAMARVIKDDSMERWDRQTLAAARVISRRPIIRMDDPRFGREPL
jgi:hypothetical protein